MTSDVRVIVERGHRRSSGMACWDVCLYVSDNVGSVLHQFDTRKVAITVAKDIAAAISAAKDVKVVVRK